MNKFKVFLLLSFLSTLFACTDISTGYSSLLDTGSDNYNKYIADSTDANKNGTPDMFDYIPGKDIQNYQDSAYLASHPIIDSILNGVSKKQVEDTVEDPIVTGESELKLQSTYYEIEVGATFDPATDIEFTAKDLQGNDASDKVTFEGIFDTNTPGTYNITVKYGKLSKAFVLVVNKGQVIVPGEPGFNVSVKYYQIMKDDTFEPSVDVKYTAWDSDGNDAKGDVVFSGDFDVHTVGEYTLKAAYADIEVTYTLSVKGDVIPDTSDNTGNFSVVITHDYKISNTLIQVDVGYVLDLPLITATLLDGTPALATYNPTKSKLKTGDEFTTPGTYDLYWNLLNLDNSSDFTTFHLVIKVIGESTITYSEDIPKDVFNVKLGDSYTLPTASGVDGEGNPFEITRDDGGFDPNKEGVYTVTYKNGDKVIRTLTITVSDMSQIELSDSNKSVVLEPGSYEVNFTKAGTVYFQPTGQQVTVTIDGVPFAAGTGWYLSSSVKTGKQVVEVNVTCTMGYQ